MGNEEKTAKLRIWANRKKIKVLSKNDKYLCPFCLRNKIGKVDNSNEYQCFSCFKVFEKPIDGTLKFQTRQRKCCSVCNSIGISSRNKYGKGRKKYYCERCKSETTVKTIMIIYTEHPKITESDILKRYKEIRKQ